MGNYSRYANKWAMLLHCQLGFGHHSKSDSLTHFYTHFDYGEIFPLMFDRHDTTISFNLLGFLAECE